MTKPTTIYQCPRCEIFYTVPIQPIGRSRICNECIEEDFSESIRYNSIMNERYDYEFSNC